MKLAVSGKGSAGKSTLAAALVLLMARRGRNVLAVDADPDACSVLAGPNDGLLRRFEDILNNIEAPS